MSKLTTKIQKLNEVYHTMKKEYTALKKMFKNHSTIKQKFILSEEILMQGYMLVKEKIEETESHREFNRIIKNIRKKKK